MGVMSTTATNIFLMISGARRLKGAPWSRDDNSMLFGYEELQLGIVVGDVMWGDLSWFGREYIL